MYVMGTPGYIKKAESLAKQNLSTSEVVKQISGYLNDYFQSSGKIYKPKSLMESRFTPPEIAFEIKMKSCGSTVNIAVEMLRHIGYKVKKIHGSVPESPDHAWIKINDEGTWHEYDLMRRGNKISEDHKKTSECDDWEDIKEDLLAAFLKWREKRV